MTSPSDRFIYWKIEPKKAKWICIPDTDEAKRNAIKAGAMFFTWAALSEPYKGNGQPEPHRWGDLPLDFDSKEIGEALAHLRTLSLVHLPEIYDIDPYEMQFYLSGGKGFHLVIPARLLGAEAGDPRLPEIYKQIVTGWKERLNLETLDLSLYNMKRGHMFRIPNIKRSNGKYKVPLSLDEIMRASGDDLMELGKKPRHISKDD